MILSSRNSQFRDEYSLEQITNAPVIYEPLTKLQCCPTSDGSAAAILASEQFVIENGLQEKVNGVHLYKFINYNTKNFTINIIVKLNCVEIGSRATGDRNGDRFSK